MLRARLLDSIASDGIGNILHNPEAHKLLVSKQNGDIEVYSMEDRKLKLFQTYPRILQSSHTDETVIKGLYMSTELSTVFARCEKALLLFNNTNLHKYDQIVDKRGIDNCWIFEVAVPKCDDKMTYLIYSTKATSKLRMLIWEGRIYRKIVEASLGSDNEIVQSVSCGKKGIILATDMAVYHWSYGESVLSRIDKIVKRKYPQDMVKALDQLKTLSRSREDESDHFSKANQSAMTTSRITKKSSIMSFWKSRKGYNTKQLTKVRYVFAPTSEKHVMFDGFTRNLFTFGLSSNDLPYMEASDHTQFIEWNCDYSKIQQLAPSLLILSNRNSIRFVDYEVGFTFLQQDIPEGIEKIEVIGGCFFIVWTKDNQLKLFEYIVDDGSDDSFDDEESICGDIYESDFYQLWRKVLFYDFFLNSPDALQLCESNDPEESLNLCALKLRDLTVLFCLGIFDRFESYMNVLRKETPIAASCMRLQEIIIQNIFEKFVEFWAPPQLILLRTFPSSISNLVVEMTGQNHACLSSNAETHRIFEVSKDLLRKWLLPYLVEIRRVLRNVSREDSVTWKISGRNIKVGVDFFLLDRHGSFDISSLLVLIDTVLFQIYLYYFPSMVGPLLSVENRCDYNIVVGELRDKHKFQELVYFYFQRDKHEEALAFLTDLYTNVEEHSDYTKIKDGIRILVLDYLKKLSPRYQDLIFKYTEWLLKRCDPEENILQRVFLNDSPLSADRDHLQIYEFIDRLDKEISLKYLEFVISNFRSQNIQLHTLLIKRYFEELDRPTTRIKIKSVLETTSIYEPRTILRLLEDAKSQGKGLSTDQSNFVESLKIYPLQRLGKYEEAVNILFDKLGDYNATSSFCAKVYKNSRGAGRSILLHFFRQIINSSNANKDSLLALFMQEHSPKLDTVEIYKLLPDSVSLHDLKEVLLQTVKSHFIKKDDTRIRKNLLQVEVIKTGYDLNKSLSKYFIIDENYACPICKKVLPISTTDTALWFDSSNRNFVVHYTCGRAFEGKIQTKKQKAKVRANRTVGALKSSELKEACNRFS